MAWIESHQSLQGHPKTKKLARLLETSIPTTIGYLHVFWWWALDYAEDGSLAKYDVFDIADAACWEGDAQKFTDSMVAAGFLDNGDQGLAIHDWYDYAGKLVERRVKDRERKQKAREGLTGSEEFQEDFEEFQESSEEFQEMSSGHPADIQLSSNGNPTGSIRNSNPVPGTLTGTTTGTKTHPPPPRAARGLPPRTARGEGAPGRTTLRPRDAPCPGFVRFWDAYPRKVAKPAAEKAWRKLAPPPELLEAILASVSLWAASDAWQREGGQFIPYPATFLNQRRWEDSVPGEVVSSGYSWEQSSPNSTDSSTSKSFEDPYFELNTPLNLTDEQRAEMRYNLPSARLERERIAREEEFERKRLELEEAAERRRAASDVQ